jgi:hypothetical protein
MLDSKSMETSRSTTSLAELRSSAAKHRLLLSAKPRLKVAWLIGDSHVALPAKLQKGNNMIALPPLLHT